MLERTLREEWGTLLLWGLVFASVLAAAVTLHRITESRGIPIGVAFCRDPDVRDAEITMLMTVRAFVAWHTISGGTPQLRLEEASYERDPSVALAELHRRGVRGVVGFSTSGAAAGALPLGERLALPILSVGATASRFVRTEDWLFRTRVSTGEDADAYVALCRRQRIRTIVVLSSEGNETYRTALLQDMAARGGPKVLGIFPYHRVLGGEFPGAGDVVGDPDGVVVVGPPVPSVWMGQRARQIWPRSTLILSPWSLLALPAEEGRLLGEGVLAADVFFDGKEDPTHPFVRFWRGRFGEIPINVTVQDTFLAMRWFADALQASGGAGGGALRRALSLPRTVKGLGVDISVDAFGDAQAPLFPLRLHRDGLFREFRP